MLWIGITFVVIMGYQWNRQRKKGGDRAPRRIVLAVSFLLFLLAEVQFMLKDRWNLPMLSQSISKTVESWLF
ncbi:hypothetical protein J25TS5_02730 [Paenibacillus faecis]|uniref:hypothetical protein n=1 Tax=Paenibacillus faecis TaxID=862114 RepID=UPI001B02FBF8|nr:hypothetical protein [Paenibacillus faecis]GIO83341.1 hypothetical protein J25TS5_02730 [Paenibacillus faecis]